MRIRGSHVFGSAVVLPLLGENVVDLDSSVFHGRVHVQTAFGHLALRIRDNIFADNVVFRGGLFDDDVFLDDGSNVFGGSLKVKWFNDFSNDLIDAAFEDLGELAFE